MRGTLVTYSYLLDRLHSTHCDQSDRNIALSGLVSAQLEHEW